MKARTKFLIGGLLVVIMAVSLMISATRQTGSYFVTPGSYRFRVTDGAQSYPVVYRGIAPDTFTDGVDVVVEGRLQRDGTFHATTLLAKCASRYENAPENVRQTPGYQQGTRQTA